MFTLFEGTMGFAPDKSEFASLKEAALEIILLAQSYKKESDMYARMKQYHDLNIDNNAFRYSERWIVYRKHLTEHGVKEEPVMTLWINREHFADGSARVKIGKYAAFWNYKD